MSVSAQVLAGQMVMIAHPRQLEMETPVATMLEVVRETTTTTAEATAVIKRAEVVPVRETTTVQGLASLASLAYLKVAMMEMLTAVLAQCLSQPQLLLFRVP